MVRRLIVMVLLAGMTQAEPAHAWWDYGHRTVAAIAQRNMTPRARAHLRQLFTAERDVDTPACPLRTIGDASVWPDCVRKDPDRWHATFAWHYQTHDICHPFIADDHCAGGACVSTQIRRNRAIVGDRHQTRAARLVALAFLVHLVGDIHQPLHAGDRDDAGGNKQVAFYGLIGPTNLHAIWDGYLAERAISTGPSLIRRYGRTERRRLAGGTVDDWARESWALARDVVYPQVTKGNVCTTRPDNPIHFGESEVATDIPLIRYRIMQAGLRLARLLNGTLG